MEFNSIQYRIRGVHDVLTAYRPGRFQKPLMWCQMLPHGGTSSEFQRGEFRENRLKTRHCVILHAFLSHNITFLSVETRNSCLSEAASGTTFEVVGTIFKVVPDAASLLVGRTEMNSINY